MLDKKRQLTKRKGENSTLIEKEKYEQVWEYNRYRDFSPGEEAVDKFNVIDRLRQHGVKTVLDAGCGSGKMMKKIIDQVGDELIVQGFDLASNCLDPIFDELKDDILTVGCLWDSKEFKKIYDAILCVDVLEHIPTKHIPAVLTNIHNCTRKFCYLGIALFPDGFGPEILGTPLHLTVKKPKWWLEQILIAGFKVEDVRLEKHISGVDLWLHLFLIP